MPYTPAEDTYLTLESVEEIEEGDICVDVGTGTCIVGMALAAKCRVTLAVDIDLNSCKMCKPPVDVVCSDVANAVRRADVVVFNLPYLPPEEPTDAAVHDTGVVPRFLRWISMVRPRVVVLTFSSLGRADFILDALRAQCAVVRARKIHLFFETIYTVTAVCPKPRQ
ncbi:N5-glutamine methyltransferase [Pyrobaculum ferrireducens]|jgi:release factor glutamine methyltransferase|uniref:N5-glutamine methyltransferase n=1 Tax=Pyrobaculum ferrireducens TaxID=1104324 RepID=G7VGS5_9CREN|nr:N5-glutamine methyltransferase [Pyrobaculum ferrireducens]